MLKQVEVGSSHSVLWGWVLISAFEDFSAKLKMAEGGVGHEENDFSPDFREYMERELYDSSRVYRDWPWKDRGFVFWDRRDGYPDLTLPNYHSLDFDPNLRTRLKIRRALRKLIEYRSFTQTLFQFWAPIKTVEGRTYLTVQNQPFAFDSGDSGDFFCQHRTRICNLLFDAHAECAEEQLGFPAHVFLHKLPESAPYPSYNTPDLASSHRIKATWALPVFEKNYSACVGVLEIASCYPLSRYWDSGGFLDSIREYFQEFGLSCLDEHKHCIMQLEDKNEAHIAAFKELEVACKSLYVIPEVSFAIAWVSSRSCSDLLRRLFRLRSVNCDSLLKSPGILHVRKVHIIGSEVPISSLSCYWDIEEWNYESLFPIEVYTGCFTMCLRSSNTCELYVVQLYLSTCVNNDNYKLTKFRLILDTMKGYFKTFRLAYGQEWGEELPLAVIDYRKDQKNHHIEKIPATDPKFLTDGPVTLALQLGLSYQPSATGCIPSLEHLKDGRVMLQVGYQPSVHTITNGSEAQNSNSPSLVSLPNGIEVMPVDSSDQKSHSIETIPATTRCIPSQRRPPSVDSVNNGMYVCTEPPNSYTLSDPSHDSLPNDSDPNLDSMPNGIEMTQVDSSDQASVDPSNSFEDQEQSMELNSDDRASAIGTFRNPGIQDANTVTVRAKVENRNYILKFDLSSTPRLVELQQEVEKRNIDPGAYDIIYTDKHEKPIRCDFDLQQWIEKSTLLGNTSITITLRPKQPSPP